MAWGGNLGWCKTVVNSVVSEMGGGAAGAGQRGYRGHGLGLSAGCCWDIQVESGWEVNIAQA